LNGLPSAPFMVPRAEAGMFERALPPSPALRAAREHLFEMAVLALIDDVEDERSGS